MPLVMLAACELEATVKVVGGGPQPRFDVTYNRGTAACIKGLTVTDLSGGRRRDIWAVRRITDGDAAPCAANVSFGVVPANYEVAVPLERLAHGRTYEVSTRGIGWHADAPFVATP